MEIDGQMALIPRFEGSGDILSGLLRGYRFSVCTTPEAAGRAIDVRRRVYIEGSGYQVQVPDEYDARSWFLLAEHLESGEAVGSLRLTPRFAGSFEAEEYFTLPDPLRSPKAMELNRFAILPAYRKGKTFLPVVSLGLFKLVMEFLRRLGTHYMVIASKPARIWTYEWMRFERTGLVAKYAKLDYSEHELLTYDFRRAASILEGHPFRHFFVEAEYPEVVVPRSVPSLGLAAPQEEERFALRKSA